MIEIVNLNNLGVLLTEVPKDLFQKIKDESESLETNNSQMVSDLSGSGVVKHYYMNKDNQKEFFEFLMYLKDVYIEAYPQYVPSFKSFSHSVPYVCGTPWFNIQRRGQFIPNHTHDGLLSYSLWVKIPYDVEEETKQGIYASCFEFNYSNITGTSAAKLVKVDKSFEGKIIMFPASLQHCVYPFHTVDDVRISMSGNILFDTEKSKLN